MDETSGRYRLFGRLSLDSAVHERLQLLLNDVLSGGVQNSSLIMRPLPHPQTVVVVRLLAELFRAQDIQLAHLAGKSFRISKALGEEHDLGNERIVWHHHRHRAEAHLPHFPHDMRSEALSGDKIFTRDVDGDNEKHVASKK